MKDFLRKISGVVVITSLVVGFQFSISSRKASAAVPTPFGGLAVAMFPCTCQGGSFNWFAFIPLYIGVVPVVGALVAPPAIAFPSYSIKAGFWALGFYSPGAGSFCTVGVPPYCYPLANMGLILPVTGSGPGI